jgi:hypothetical protein
MHCIQTALLNCCLSRSTAGHERVWNNGAFRPPLGRNVALLIDLFPRSDHPLSEFYELLCLLRQHGATCTFFFNWEQVRACKKTQHLCEVLRLISVHGHEAALWFGREFCTQPVPKVRQDAIEALHFMQRLYGTTVCVAKLSLATPSNVAALQELGLLVVGECPGGGTLSLPDTSQLLSQTREALEEWTAVGKRSVRLSVLIDEI